MMTRRHLLRIAFMGVILLSTLTGRGADDAQKGANLPTAQQVIDYLKQSVDWHRHLTVEEQIATDPADILFLNDDRQIAKQILQLAFDFAKAYAPLVPSQPVSETTAGEASKYQALFREAAATDANLRQLQGEIADLKAKLQTAHGANRKKLQSTLDETQSELNLAETRSQTLHAMLQFVSGAGSSSSGNLPMQIEEIERSIPELEADSTKASGTQSNPHPVSAGQGTSHRPQAAGILGLVEELFSLKEKKRALDGTIQLTDTLSRTSQQFRNPFMARVTSEAQRGEQLAQEADVSGPAQLEQQKRELDALTASFKQISAIVLPLGKQAVLFDLYKSNVARWRSTVEGQYSAILRKLIVRAALLALIVAIVLGLSEIWRRATFRYVHDLRRRYQFLLLRRIVLWFVIGITIAFALATEIGSLATFAGLITAGIAVALQNVILAVAGYFFLIGKYGVKVGDRVQISGVAGDVVDIGLIRLHLMEIAGTGADRQPTGRVVVFSNSIVFQPGASFYRQIPGTNFLWHQLTLTLSPEADYAAAEKRLREAIERVYERYKEKIEQQHRQMEQTLNMPIAMPRIRTHVIPRDNGLEVTIRYPVDAEHAADIDDQITRELLADLKQAPEFKLAGSGVPSIKSVDDESKAA
ncbi:MAG TPA: mechanosensitive ion channel family protein [Candidatus Angelobacter sp.]|jgi:small-conductance mechanosensitive channel|nr:mechanosensitive ion channel family protein [Candidatus Angelobacter sp.]